MMKKVTLSILIHPSAFCLLPSAFIPHPSSFILAFVFPGVTLDEYSNHDIFFSGQPGSAH